MDNKQNESGQDNNIRIDPDSMDNKQSESKQASKPNHNIDFKIFESSSTHCNVAGKDKNGIISNCIYLRRLSMGLKYYHLLFMNDDKLNKSKVSKELFIQFSIETYGQILNDWQHFIKKHSSNHDLIFIVDELQNRYNVKPCSMTKCSKLRRHYRNGRKTDDFDEDGVFSFYIDCYDRFHHHIFHLFQMGLRIKTESKMDEMDDGDINNIDFDFKLKRDLISRTKKQNGLDDLERYNEENNKFNLQIDVNNNNDNNDNKQIFDERGCTFLDGVYLFISKYENIARVNEEIRGFKTV